MHPVQRLHLIAVLGDVGVSPDIMDRNFVKGIDGKNHSLEDGIENAEDNGCFAGLCKFPFREINRENEQADQHDVDIDKIDAGHHRDTPVIVVQDADQVTDVHHGRACAGKSQISSRGPVLQNGFYRQNSVSHGDQNGNFYIEIQKPCIHVEHPSLSG